MHIVSVFTDKEADSQMLHGQGHVTCYMLQGYMLQGQKSCPW